MFEKIAELILKLNLKADLVTYVLLGIILLAWLVPLLSGIFGSEFSKTCSVMHKIAQNPKAANEYLKKNISLRLKKEIKSVVMPNVKLFVGGDETFIYEIYSRSLLKRIVFSTLIATIISIIASYFLFGSLIFDVFAVYIAPVMILVFGSLLMLLGLLFAHLLKRSAVSCYKRFFKALVAQYASAMEQKDMVDSKPSLDTEKDKPSQQNHTVNEQINTVTPVPSFSQPPVQKSNESLNTVSSIDQVIARIDKISVHGAPLPVMREVTMQLQQERSKTENKTPENQRRLNEALSKLLKAMANVNNS